MNKEDNPEKNNQTTRMVKAWQIIKALCYWV
jgi:hypothetical protein